ncbi:uncharacterized protein LOC131857908 [Cryptomeria japonica]|uniref:uncharacterized protein LOC131857908 n=1 Tax=Cryptomeria japonica TaxID=3369 RepID=UPI0027DA4E21|nr:uncharacterized protein LOC131857908 [Cryptomeria japonica]
MDGKKVPLIGQVKDAQAVLAACLDKRVKLAILVVDIPTSYGRLLSRTFCRDLGGEIKMDWSSVPDNVNHWQLFDIDAQIKASWSVPIPLSNHILRVLKICVKNFAQILVLILYKIAFITRWGMFAYNRMPFGLINTGATFQRAMDYSFKDIHDRIIVVYLNDLTVFSKVRKNYLQDLRLVLQHFREHGISLNPKKSVFYATKGKLLGHIVSKEGIKIDPKRVNAIQHLSLPSNRIGVRSFFGQVDGSGTEAPIAFMRIPLKKHELKYLLSEKQSFIMVKVVKQFQYYILHSHYVVFVLDSTVKSILTQQEVGLNKRATWVTKIQEYDLDTHPTKMVKGQGLCKLIADTGVEIDEGLPLTLFVGLQDTWFSNVAYYLTYGSFLGHLSTKEQRNLKLKAAKYVILQDVLYKKGLDGTYLRCVDKPQQQKLLEECEKCQLFFGKPHLAALPLRLVVVDEPFKKWDIDFIGPINPHSSAGHVYSDSNRLFY